VERGEFDVVMLILCCACVSITIIQKIGGGRYMTLGGVIIVQQTLVPML